MSRRRYVDIAANLTDCVFRGIDWKGKTIHADDFDVVMARAMSSGVDKIVISGTSLAVSAQAVELCRRYPGVLYCTVGVHPAHADDWLLPSRIPPPPPKAKTNTQKKPAGTAGSNSSSSPGDVAPTTPTSLLSIFDDAFEGQRAHRDGLLDALRALIRDNRDVVVAVGEIGLDYAELSHVVSPQLQRESFLLQLQLAVDFDLPLFLHSRECGLDFVKCFMDTATVDNAAAKAVVLRGGRGVVHSFNGSDDELRAVLALGFHIGVNASAFRTEETARRVVQLTPLRRLLIETDAPWCDVRPTDYGAQFVTTWPKSNAKTAFVLGECVDRRNEPCHIAQVAEAYLGARRLLAPYGTVDGVAQSSRAARDVSDEGIVAQLRSNVRYVFPLLADGASLE
jgi:TatD DNase family protein